MRNTCLFLLMALVLLFLNNCKEPPEPTDPCEGQYPTSADFIVEQQVGDRWFEGDTIISSQQNVRFTAKYEADSYIWKVGSETITTRSFIRTTFPEQSFIPIQLIVKKKANTDCFPNDKEADTLTKDIYVWHRTYGVGPGETPLDTTLSPYMPIYGTYYGQSTYEPNQKKFVTLIDTIWDDGQFPELKRVGILRGFPYRATSTEKARKSKISRYIRDSGFRTIYFNMTSSKGDPPLGTFIPRLRGYAWLDRNDLDILHMEYEFVDTATNNWMKDTFVGKRVW